MDITSTFRDRKHVYTVLITCILCMSFSTFWVFPSTPLYAAAIPPGGTGSSGVNQDIGNRTILLIHGVNAGIKSGVLQKNDCTGYWKDVLDYLHKSHDGLQWQTNDIRTIQYYNTDYNCAQTGHTDDADYNLHNPKYTSHCMEYYPGGTSFSNDGTLDESIYHLSCLLAWYIHLNFDTPNRSIEIVAHSMGGLIVRNAIYQVQKRKLPGVMPPSLGSISSVTEFGTPNYGTAANPCLNDLGFSCVQGNEMLSYRSFMREMKQPQAQNPQAGKTDWTLVSSTYDDVAAGGESGLDMRDAAHRVLYTGHPDQNADQSKAWGYNHADYLQYLGKSFDGKTSVTVNDDENKYELEWCSLQLQGHDTCNNKGPSLWPSTQTGVSPMHVMWFTLWNFTW